MDGPMSVIVSNRKGISIFQPFLDSLSTTKRDHNPIGPSLSRDEAEGPRLNVGLHFPLEWEFGEIVGRLCELYEFQQFRKRHAIFSQYGDRPNGVIVTCLRNVPRGSVNFSPSMKVSPGKE